MDSASAVEKLQKDYLSKGANAGKKNLPPSLAKPFDANELQLIAEGRRRSVDNFHKYQRFEAGKEKLLGDLQNDLESVPATCNALIGNQDLNETIAQKLAGERLSLVDLAKKMLSLRGEQAAYRLIHGITEEAVMPAYAPAPYLWLLPVILLETVIGASFYENANGLIGGAMVALMVSFANVAFAFLCGALFRYKNLQPIPYRFFGWAMMPVAIFAAVCLNTIFARYRSVYQLVVDPTDPAQLTDAFISALDSATNVFHMRAPATDIQSFCLFFLGLAGCGWAFYKGMRVDDRYPGYGPRARRLKEAEDLYDAKCLLVKGLIQVEIAKQKEEVAAAKNVLTKAPATLQQIRVALRNEHAGMQKYQQQLQENFALILATYRKANIAARQTEPPEYFGEIPGLADDVDMNRESTSEQLVAGVNERIKELHTQYYDTLTSTLTEMGNEAKVILGDTYAKFLESVIEDARNKLGSGIIAGPEIGLVQRA